MAQMKVKACLTEESKKEFATAEVKDEKEFDKVVENVDSPIFECEEAGETFAIDTQRKIRYILKKQG